MKRIAVCCLLGAVLTGCGSFEETSALKTASKLSVWQKRASRLLQPHTVLWSDGSPVASSKTHVALFLHGDQTLATEAIKQLFSVELDKSDLVLQINSRRKIYIIPRNFLIADMVKKNAAQLPDLKNIYAVRGTNMIPYSFYAYHKAQTPTKDFFEKAKAFAKIYGLKAVQYELSSKIVDFSYTHRAPLVDVFDGCDKLKAEFSSDEVSCEYDSQRTVWKF